MADATNGFRQEFMHVRNQNTIQSLWLLNDALIKIYLREKERVNSRRNRTVKMISSYETINWSTKRERGEGEREERERGGGIGIATA